MANSDRRTLRRRLAWFAGSLLLIAALAAAFWFGRPAPSPPPPEPVPQVPAPAPAPPLVREDLGLDGIAAAVTSALRPPLDGGPRAAPIMGRRFRIAIPFGCAGPVAEGAQASLGYTYDPRQGAITLTARPADWTDSALVRAVSAPEQYEAVEGFWVLPLTAAAQGCVPPSPAGETIPAAGPAPTQGAQPASKDDAEARQEEKTGPGTPPPEPRVGLARFFETGASRAAQRRNRPYRATRKVEGPAASFPQGFRLVLSGRVAEGQDEPVIRCGAAASTPAPECLVAVEFDRVVFEDAATGEVLASWDR